MLAGLSSKCSPSRFCRASPCSASEICQTCYLSIPSNVQRPLLQAGRSTAWRSTFVCPSMPLGGSFPRVLCSLMGPERDGQLVQLFLVIRRETQLQGLCMLGLKWRVPVPPFYSSKFSCHSDSVFIPLALRAPLLPSAWAPRGKGLHPSFLEATGTLKQYFSKDLRITQGNYHHRKIVWLMAPRWLHLRVGLPTSDLFAKPQVCFSVGKGSYYL